MKRTVALLILDGWGVGVNDITNAIYAAQPETMDMLARRYPTGTLLAHGIAVGLPWEEAGTGAAGHLTIGAGRTVYQPLPRITLAIRDGSFFTNKVLLAAMRHAQKNKGAVHLVGTLAENNARSSLAHLLALIKMGMDAGVLRMRVHALLGGGKENPRGALALIKKILWSKTVSLASLTGHYYALAADESGSRLRAAANALQGLGARTNDPERYLHDFYLHGMGDEFVEPVALGPDSRGVEENDAVVFCDFAGAGMGGLIQSVRGKNILVTTMVSCGLPADIPVAFPEERIQNTLGAILASYGKIQFKIAETDRYSQVTYCMNGLSNDPLRGEYRILIPSENVARKDERPEMMTREIANRGIAAIEEGADFVLMNFAAPDVMAHTGNFDATIKAVRAVDRELGGIVNAVLAQNGALIITADHGNAERMRDPVTGAVETGHNTNPVPVLLIAKELEKSPQSGVPSYGTTTAGLLTDIAPTVLAFMGLTKPAEMTGSSLIGKLA